MILTMPFQTTAGTVRRLRISLPLIADLVDGQKYFLPDDLAPAKGEELRPMMRPRVKAPRGPSLKSMVKAAVQRENARELDRLFTAP